MPIIEIKDDDHFDDIIENTKKNVVLVFSAKWCGPCSKIRPKWENWSKQNPNHTFLYIDVDKCCDTAEIFDIDAMPTFIKYDERSRFVGSNVTKLLQFLSS